MIVISNPNEMRDWCKQKRDSIGFVPTMGSLHEGHLALIRQARKENTYVVVSIYVNPTQFGPHEDFESYPRVPERDCELISDVVDVVFLPTDSCMYPLGKNTHELIENKLSNKLCGASRPGHFDGVLKIVLKLLQIIPADKLYMGLKDFQQQLLISRMIEEFYLPVRMIACPTVREPSGLALSSRNQYLSYEEQQIAPLLYKTIVSFPELFKIKGCDQTCRELTTTLEKEGFQVDYLQILDQTTLDEAETLNENTRIFVAARLGSTRLIDNYGVYDA